MKKLTYEQKIQKLKERALKQKEKLKEKALKREQRLKDRLHKAKLKKPKAPSRKELSKRLWKLTSMYVRNIEPSCYTCGKIILDVNDREAGHYWTQGTHKRVKFDLMNVHTQCVSCNKFKSGNLGPYASRLLRDYGLERYQELEMKKNDSTPFTPIELEQMILEMEEKIKSLIL